MTREIKGDFDKLVKFINEYNLSKIIDDDFKVYLSQMHKKYYAMLLFVTELNSLKDKNGNNILENKQKEFILETISDLGNAVFLIINGAYKPSRLILRSAIETFLKGFSIKIIIDIDKEKKIYKMFDRISDISFFEEPTNKEFFNILKQLYSKLSKDIHTADINHMQHTSTLNYFPTKSISNIKITVGYFCDISQILLSLLAIYYNEEYHRMHINNKEMIIKNIKKEFRQKINNIE